MRILMAVLIVALVASCASRTIETARIAAAPEPQTIATPLSRPVADESDVNQLTAAPEACDHEQTIRALRLRLAEALQDLYAAAPAAGRDAMLLDMARDPLATVRLTALTLIQRRISTNEEISPELAAYVQTMLEDVDAPVRKSAALLVANFGEGKASAALLGRLKVEKVQSVREALLRALGQTRDPKALKAVLNEIPSKHEGVSAAAAIAMSRIADKQDLGAFDRHRAVEVLVERYRRMAVAGDGAALREALLTAMGVVGDAAVASVLREALKAPKATVKLAAVTAVAHLGDDSLAEALVDLTADADRGVRQAAIGALGELAGERYLRKTILAHTCENVEADAAVRRKAWDVTMMILTHADADVLWTVERDLHDRSNAVDERIKIAELLVAKLKDGQDPRLSAAQRRLAAALMVASRPAEAGDNLAEAYKAAAEAGSPESLAIWLEWIDAMLAAGDPKVVEMMTLRPEPAAFTEACRHMEAGLTRLATAGKHASVALVAREALDRLRGRLTPQDKKKIQKMLLAATAAQRLADHRRVAVLIPMLLADPAVSLEAVEELKSMGARAVEPLAEALKSVLSAEKVDPQVEKAIVSVLTQIAPKLNTYDPKAARAERLKKVEALLGEANVSQPSLQGAQASPGDAGKPGGASP
ncbi:MAG: HEAT repeat domain-containing protein [Planctomycetes bacterium]|nr:HEAT repeat domain-containing protein [Planctomycetota bacterium]